MTKKALPWPPALPRDFPLSVHPRGYVKRIGGRLRWICGKKPPAEALRIYHAKAATLLAGKKPLGSAAAAKPPDRPTIHYVLNRWLLDCRGDAERDEIKAHTFTQYRRSAKRIDAIAGHHTADEWTPDLSKALYDALHKEHGQHFARTALGHFRAACNMASPEERRWVAHPIAYGRKLVAKLTSRPQVKMKWKLYTPAQVRLILAELDRRVKKADGRGLASWQQFRAMVLLALNGGYGAQELADLPKAVVDVDVALIDYRRGKTKKDHIVPLWPETVKALRPVLAQRPDDEMLFRTRMGNLWRGSGKRMEGGALVGEKGSDHVNERFRDLVEPMGLLIPGEGFYKLRHVHATLASEAGDVEAAKVLMGHGLGGSRGHYVRIEEARLRGVVEHVRKKLLNPSTSPAARPRARGSPDK